MTQREKWLTVTAFLAVFWLVVIIFTVGLDEDPKPARTPVPIPTGVLCDPNC